ncbi:hypothetical protein K3495_g8239 [Podosphaera aphanis]|nr:hypothetical protein K3495_g8239 [Podosphaera aphanis]
MISADRLDIAKIAGTENPADILTKQLPYDPFSRHIKALGVGNFSA